MLTGGLEHLGPGTNRDHRQTGENEHAQQAPKSTAAYESRASSGPVTTSANISAHHKAPETARRASPIASAEGGDGDGGSAVTDADAEPVTAATAGRTTAWTNKPASSSADTRHAIA